MSLEEKQYIVEQTLRDMYLLLKRSQELANEMANELSGCARDYMVAAAYMSECASMPLFNCAGALGLDLVKYASEIRDKRKDKKNEKKREVGVS